jgi:hypothetical protein
LVREKDGVILNDATGPQCTIQPEAARCITRLGWCNQRDGGRRQWVDVIADSAELATFRRKIHSPTKA